MKSKWYLITLLVILLVGVASADVLTTSQFGAGTSIGGNPIGGGTGYSDIKTSGDCTATNASEFVACLGSVSSGQVVYIPETADINMTGIYSTSIPAGVTIASNRGSSGSAGGRIFWKEVYYIAGDAEMLVVGGNNVRITGLRIDGQNQTTSSITTEMFGIYNPAYGGLEIDNCEIMGWVSAGIWISLSNTTLASEGLTTTEIGSSIANIHHNYIHHNQGTGEGYGIVLVVGSALIKGNVFSNTRHAITGSGINLQGYESTYNIVIADTGTGGVFDIHGYPDEGGQSGNLYRINYNTVLTDKNYAVHVRGYPTQDAAVMYNSFLNKSDGYSVAKSGSPVNANVTMLRNLLDGVYIPGSVIAYV
jgi:hypothetical protein